MCSGSFAARGNMVINLHLFHSDSAYAAKLAAALAAHGRPRYAITVYESMEQLNSAVGLLEEDPAALLLVDYSRRKELDGRGVPAAWMTEGWTEEDIEDLHMLSSQSAAALAAAIEQAFAATRRGSYGDASAAEKAGIWAVNSLMGPSESWSWELSEALAAKGKRIFWLNLDPFPALHKNEGQPEMGSLEEVLVQMVRDPASMMALELYKWQDAATGVETLMPHRLYDDVLSIPIDKWVVWIERAASCGQYDMLVLDLGTQANQFVDAVIGLADKLLVFRSGDGSGILKEEGYRKRRGLLGKGKETASLFVDPSGSSSWKEETIGQWI